MNCKLVCAFADVVLKVDWSMRSVIVHTLKLLHATINMYPCSKTNSYTGLHSALFHPCTCLGRINLDGAISFPVISRDGDRIWSD